MNRFLFFYAFFNLPWTFIHAAPRYPVDISYLVADVKYSQEHGLKICEVQHGSLSALDGDCFIAGGDGTIAPMIADFFDQFHMKKWTAGLIYPPLQRSLATQGWSIEKSFSALSKDPTFLVSALSRPLNPFSIPSYAGMVYADCDIIRNIEFYRRSYPGILFINAATFPYWRDKYAMNMLFDGNDELKQYKAEWKLYSKKYDPFLSEKIQHDLPSDLYVIKPRSESLANGVIVVASEELDGVLRMILEPLASLQNHPDKKYAYWYRNNDDSFIIERYYESDYLCFSQPLNGSTSYATTYHYDAAMRLVFIVKYDEGKMMYYHLGAYWKLPAKALQEEGTLNEKRISCCKAPFYKTIDPALLNQVNTHMERAMLLLYEIMVNKHS